MSHKHTCLSFSSAHIFTNDKIPQGSLPMWYVWGSLQAASSKLGIGDYETRVCWDGHS
jgi:hypothetical protein